jgi:menaquinone-dependent protoporphyrinogen IX oxidase
LSFKERHRSLNTYLKPVLKKAPRVRPVSVALFAGKLDYTAMKFLQMVFVMLLFAEKPRDYRDWEIIRRWAADLRPKLFDKI